VLSGRVEIEKENHAYFVPAREQILQGAPPYLTSALQRSLLVSPFVFDLLVIRAVAAVVLVIAAVAAVAVAIDCV